MIIDNAELRKLWPALESAFDKGSAEFSCYGRKYRLAGALPSSVISGGEEVLTAPARFRACFHGEEKPFTDLDGFVTRQDGDMLEYQCMQMAGNVMINARVRAEFDGLVWVDMLLVPFGTNGTETHSPAEVKPSLDSLIVEFPMKRELAELYHYWPGEWGSIANSGGIPAEGKSIPFKPSVWIGREEAGLSIYSESDQYRQYADPDKAMTVEMTPDTAFIRMHLLDSLPESWIHPTYDDPYGPIRFSFGYQATPVRPFMQDEDFIRHFYPSEACKDNDLAAYTEEMDKWHEKGVKWRTFDVWDMVQNYGLPRDEEHFKAEVKVLHDRGMRGLAYFGFEYATCAPDFYDNFDKYLVRDEYGSYRGGWQRKPAQRDFIVCYASGYSETMLERCAHAIDEYGVDGIYTDGTYVPQGCANAAHGCGYTDRNGKRHVTYPLRTLREHVKKLYILTHERGCLVESHSSGCVIPMITAFSDSYMDGEHISETRDPVTGAKIFMTGEQMADYYLSREDGTAVYRAEFTGVNFGIPCMAISYARTYDESSGLPLLYGVYVKPSCWHDKVDQAAYHWDVRAKYELGKARFIPFWRKECPVRAENPKVRCSVWETEKGTMILAANLTGASEKTSFRVAHGYSRAVDVKTGETLPALEAEIPSMRVTYIFLEK